jgi:hypothetical protein
MSGFISNPRRPHWEAMKWTWRYLWGTTNIKICFYSKETGLIAYSDSKLVVDVDGRKSTSSYLVTHSCGSSLAGCKSVWHWTQLNPVHHSYRGEQGNYCGWNDWLLSMGLSKTIMWCSVRIRVPST